MALTDNGNGGLSAADVAAVMGNNNGFGFGNDGSGHSIKDRMVARLEDMMDEAKTDHERQTVSEWISRLQSN